MSISSLIPLAATPRHSLATGVVTALVAAASLAAHAADGLWIGPPSAPQRDRRTDGVIAQSYGYHRQLAATPQVGLSPAQPGAWYGYGFPVQTYRWGWFGAGHYDPITLWHKGYYGDECRWGYRCGY